jgi:hypothetical protein
MCKSIKRLIMLATALAAVIVPAVASARPVRADSEHFSVSPARADRGRLGHGARGAPPCCRRLISRAS